MPSLRLQRVRELLKREIGEAIRREFQVSEAGLITVNDVDVAGDLHSAVVFVSILGNADQQKRGFSLLERHRKRIQGLVGRAVVLKYTPTLRFLMDDSIVRGNECSGSSRSWRRPCRPTRKNKRMKQDRRRSLRPPEHAQPALVLSPMKPHPKIIDRIIEGIRESRTICVVGHIRPDGDCVGSQLGLTLALRNEGKKVRCWNEDRIPEKYEFLDPDGIIQKPKRGLEVRLRDRHRRGQLRAPRLGRPVRCQPQAAHQH